MLNMGFLEDMETILSALPEERQTLMFSATMPQAIQRIATNFPERSADCARGQERADRSEGNPVLL